MESGKIYGAIYENNFNEEEEEDVCLGDEHGEFRVRFYLRSMENLQFRFTIFNRITDRKIIIRFLVASVGKCINDRLRNVSWNFELDNIKSLMLQYKNLYCLNDNGFT